MGFLRSSILSSAPSDRPTSNATSLFPYHDPFSHARPSSSFLGPPGLFPPSSSTPGVNQIGQGGNGTSSDAPSSTITYHGVCLTVWSHADAERSAAIRRTLEAGRSRKESAQSLIAARLKGLRADTQDPTIQARRKNKRNRRGPWATNGGATDGETDIDAETDGGISESDYEVGSIGQSHNPGESTLFLPGDTVFWLPYALSMYHNTLCGSDLLTSPFTALVSRHPIYDLMRDYLTLSWARFSKDVQSHTLQISKILSHPAPRAGDLIKLDASATTKSDVASASGPDTSLEVIARFPGGLDFGRGLVDINFTMWPLFKALNIDNILTICEVGIYVVKVFQIAHTSKDCASTNRENLIFLSLSCHARCTFVTKVPVCLFSVFFDSCRSLWQRSSIWLNSVVGTVLHYKRSTPVMPRSILTILALGYWASPPRLGTACDHLPRCASAICELSSNVLQQLFITSFP